MEGRPGGACAKGAIVSKLAPRFYADGDTSSKTAPEPSPPAGALAQGGEGGRGLVRDPLRVDRRQLAAALEDAPVDHHGVDVGRLRRLDHEVRGVAPHGEVDVARVQHDEVGALAGHERPYAVGYAHRARALYGRELEDPARRELELVVGAAVLDILDRFHDREHVGVARDRKSVV